MKLIGNLLFVCIGSIIYSQSLPSIPVNLISDQSGLKQKDNYFIYHDSRGYTWLSSTKGLYRYDGTGVKSFLPDPGNSTSLRGLIVNGFFGEDKNSNLWFCTYQAVNCYVRSKNIFMSFTIQGEPATGYFSAGVDSSGLLWLMRDSTLYTFNTDSYIFQRKTVIKPGASRLKIYKDNAGYVSHIVAYNTGRSDPGVQLMIVNNASINESDLLFSGEHQRALSVRDVYLQGDSILWIASRAGLHAYHPQTGELHKYTPLPERQYVNFNGVERLNDSLLCITTYNLGVYTFQLDKRIFSEHFKCVSGDRIIIEPLQTLFKDRNGGIWITVPGLGVAFFHPDNFRARFYEHKIQTSLLYSGIDLNSLVELRNKKVFGSSKLQGAVLMKDPLTIEKLYNKDVTPGWPAFNTSGSLIDNKDRIWILTAEGPVFLDTHAKVHIPEPDSIWGLSICKTKTGNIILGNRNGGLLKSLENDKGGIIFERISEVDFTRQYTALYCHTDGLIYGAANLSTLDVLDPSLNFKTLNSIPFSVDVQCMVAGPEKSNIWIGTNKGILIYDPSSTQMEALDWSPELTHLTVFGIIPYRKDVWISSDQGIYRLDTEKKSYRHLTIHNGTGTINFNRNAFLLRSNGEIWFGSQDGITVIDPEEQYIEAPDPLIHITTIQVNDELPQRLECSKTGARNVSEIRSLILPYTDNTVSFEFSAMDYSGSEHASYAYRMRGVEDTWYESGTRGFARYANLPPGQYTFEVIPGGFFNKNDLPVRSLMIAIVAPFYLQQWFIILMIVVSLLAVFLIYRTYDRRQQILRELKLEKQIAVETERLRIANDMHDDLGSGLSALSLRTRLLSDKIQDQTVRQQLEELSGSTSELTKRLRETIWTINSKHDTIDDLITHLHQYALDYFESMGIQCTINLIPEQISLPISGIHRRELYLGYKEALHNVYKHAQASEVKIDITVRADQLLIISIQDNGIGFNLSDEFSGLGLQSMKKRIADLGGSINLESSHNGTLITFEYSVKR